MCDGGVVTKLSSVNNLTLFPQPVEKSLKNLLTNQNSCDSIYKLSQKTKRNQKS